MRRIRSRVLWRRVVACQRWGLKRTMDNRMHAFYRTGSPMKIELRCSAALLLVWAAEAYAQEARPEWEGAIGPNISYGPAYAGAQDHRTKIVPGFFLRYGRFTVTNSSGFVTRRSDDVPRGLGVDLSPSERLRINLALRFDAGRSTSDSPALAGLNNVRSTVRVRLAGSWHLSDGWRVGSGLSVDAVGRGGGDFADASIVREQRISSTTQWSFGGSVAVASSRYMRNYFGISAEQATRTVYPAYNPSAGLRDATVFAGVRSELGPSWVALGGVGASRLLGPAASSPLTKRPNGWGINAGLAWRF